MTLRRPSQSTDSQSRQQSGDPARSVPGERETHETVVLRLQRTIGNRATVALLQRQDTATKTIDKTQKPPIGPPAPVGYGFPPLSAKERAELERFTGNRIDRAFVAFVSACKDNREAVKAAAKAQAENVALFIDIATGFLVPGLSKGLAKLANNLPVNASNVAYRAALVGLNTDVTKQVFSSATKVANKFMKDNSMTLFGETETDHFIKSLEGLFHRGADEIDKGLPNLTDMELGVVCAMYDPAVADVDAFRAEILALVTRFQQQVLKSEEKSVVEMSQVHTRFKGQHHAWVDLGGGRKRLALLVRDTLNVTMQPTKVTWSFYSWISPDMEQMVLAKWGRGRFGEGLPTVKKADVGGLVLPSHMY